MIIDPICRLTVDESTERRAYFNGETLYFCSERCREKFHSAPDAEKHKVFHQDIGAHTCEKHPELWQEDPCNCPKCRMELEPGPKHAHADAQRKSKSFEMIGRIRIATSLVISIARGCCAISKGHLSRFVRQPGRSILKSQTRFPTTTQSAR